MLPPAAKRTPIHTRTIELQGYLREDNLWDVEAHLKDVKGYDFHNEWRGEVLVGEPVHDMWFRITINDDFVIQDVAVSMPSTPYHICPQVIPNFMELKGLKIGKGWRRGVAEKVGGTDGCTHLVELLGPMATVAIQTIRPYKRYQTKQILDPDVKDTSENRTFQLNTCYSWSTEREVVQRWLPEFYTGDQPPPTSAPPSAK